MERLLTPDEVIKILGIDKKTLAGHVAAGDIAFIAIGRGTVRQRRRFTEKDVQAFIDKRRTINAPPQARARRVSGKRGSVLGTDGPLFTDRLKRMLGKGS